MPVTSPEALKASKEVKVPTNLNPKRPFETATAGTSATNDPSGTDRNPPSQTGGGG